MDEQFLKIPECPVAWEHWVSLSDRYRRAVKDNERMSRFFPRWDIVREVSDDYLAISVRISNQALETATDLRELVRLTTDSIARRLIQAIEFEGGVVPIVGDSITEDSFFKGGCLDPFRARSVIDE